MMRASILLFLTACAGDPFTSATANIVDPGPSDAARVAVDSPVQVPTVVDAGRDAGTPEASSPPDTGRAVQDSGAAQDAFSSGFSDGAVDSPFSAPPADAPPPPEAGPPDAPSGPVWFSSCTPSSAVNVCSAVDPQAFCYYFAVSATAGGPITRQGQICTKVCDMSNPCPVGTCDPVSSAANTSMCLP